MKLNKLYWIMAILYSAISICSCSENNEPDADGSKTDNGGYLATYSAEKLDVSNAVALALVETSGSRANEFYTLHKIDADGELSIATLSVRSPEDVKNIIVHPRDIRTIAGGFTYLFDCNFSDENGNQTWIPRPAGQESFYYCMLVNNKTGKIYFVNEQAQNYFGYQDGYGCDAVTDDNGNIFLRNVNHGVAKMIVDGDNIIISQFGPVDFGCPPGHMIALKSGALAFINGMSAPNDLTIFYPNGGYESLSGERGSWVGAEDCDVLNFSHMPDGRILAVRLPKEQFYEFYNYDAGGWQYTDPAWKVEIVEITVGTQYGSIVIGSPLLEWHGEHTDLMSENFNYSNYGYYDAPDWTYTVRQGHYLTSIYESNRYLFINDILAYDKVTGDTRDLIAEKIQGHVITPGAENIYQGKVWQVWADGADWFDTESLEFGTVSLPSLSQYTILTSTYDIPNGKVYHTVLSPVDGHKYMFTIDITTGQSSSTPIEQQVASITLVPLN